MLAFRLDITQWPPHHNRNRQYMSGDQSLSDQDRYCSITAKAARISILDSKMFNFFSVETRDKYCPNETLSHSKQRRSTQNKGLDHGLVLPSLKSRKRRQKKKLIKKVGKNNFRDLNACFLLKSAQRHLGFKYPSGYSLYQMVRGKFYFPIKVRGQPITGTGERK